MDSALSLTFDIYVWDLPTYGLTIKRFVEVRIIEEYINDRAKEQVRLQLGPIPEFSVKKVVWFKDLDGITIHVSVKYTLLDPYPSQIAHLIGMPV